MDEGFQALVEEVTVAVVETAREVGVELEDVTEFLKSWEKLNGWGVASYGWAKKEVSWDAITPGEDDMMIVEMTA